MGFGLQKKFRWNVLWLCALGVMVFGPSRSADAEVGYLKNRTMRCDIEVNEHQGHLRLQGVAFSSRTVNGIYEMQVLKTEGAGSSTIRQAGGFHVEADKPAKLGLVQLGGTAATYSAKLTLRSDGQQAFCEKIIELPGNG